MPGSSLTLPKKTSSTRQLSSFVLVTCISLISFFPLNILLPSFPALAGRFNTSLVDIAFAVSLFTFIYSLSQLVTGPLSDKLGRKEVLLGCLAISVLGAIGCTLSESYMSFLIFRGIQAIGCGFFVLGHALVEDLFDEKDRADMRLYYMTLGGAFVALSPLLGSWLQTTFDWKSSFYVFFIMAIGIFIHAWLILPANADRSRSEHLPILSSLKIILSNRDFVRYWWIAALVFSCYFALIGISPLIFMGDLKLSEYQYAIVLLVYGVAYILGGVLASALQKRISLRVQINTGLILLAIAGLFLLMMIEIEVLTTVSLLIPMLISAIAVTLVRPAAISAAMLLFSSNAGTAASAGNTIMFITAAISSAALAYAGAQLIPTIAISFIGFSLLGLLTNARIGR